MKKKIGILAMQLFLLYTLRAQNFTTREHCFLTDFVFNPAAAGTEEGMVAVLSAKKNWTGLKGSPGTNMFSLHLKASDLGISKPRQYISKDFSKTGIGLGLYNDMNGPLVTTAIQLAYARHVRLNNKLFLSFGLSAKLTQYMLDESVLKATDPDDNDLTFQKQSTILPNFNSGLYLRHKSYHIGLSVTNLFNLTNNNNINFYKEELMRTWYLSGAYLFKLPASNGLEPKLLVRYYNKQIWVDVLVRYYFQKHFWVGLGYATTGFYSFYAALKFGKFDYGYTFEYSPSPIYKTTHGNHMLFISYNLPGL